MGRRARSFFAETRLIRLEFAALLALWLLGLASALYALFS